MRRVLAVTLSLAALLAAASPALAQRTTGTIVGVVKDDTGGILPGVSVAIKGPTIVGLQTGITNERGLYRFAAVPPGSYDITFAISGFRKLNREAVKLSVGATIEENASLKVSALSEEITVSGEAEVVDTTTNQVSTTYDKERVRNAPVPRFSFFDLINQAPGVSQSVQGGSRSTAFGSGSDENSYQIDGTNLTSSFIGTAWP